jgi:hypothetical protein
MRPVDELINEIIPPADYAHRNGFNNEPIIDTLDDSEKLLIENELIKMILNSNDLLIAETLAYIKSTNSLQVLKNKLDTMTNPNEIIILAAAIFRIDSKDFNMANIAYNSFLTIKDKYSLISLFYYLARFNDTRINKMIRSFFDNKDFLISYNSKRAMGIDVKI